MVDHQIEILTDIPTGSATEQVFQALYSSIVALRLPPRQSISEVEIAKQLNVSRQPVRDAFFRLSELGLILIRPQRRTLIAPISKQAVLEAVFVRLALEVECLRDAIPKVTAQDIAALRTNIEHQSRALDTKDQTKFHALDEEMHAAICTIAGQPQVWRLIHDHKAHMDRIRFLTLSTERRSQVFDDHVKLVDAIEDRNLKVAEPILRSHLSDLRNQLSRIVNDYPQYFDEKE